MPNRSDLLPVLASVPGALCSAVVIALVVAAPGFIAQPVVQWLPWAVGLLAFGIPHGALDHRVDRESDSVVPRLGFLAGYLGLMGLVLASWWLSPMLALLGFLAVAAFHFGQGDLYWSRALREGVGPDGELADRDGRWPGTRSALFLLVRGLVPIALPVLVFADAFGESANALAGRLFGGSSRWDLPEGVRIAGLALVGGLVVLHLGSLVIEALRRPDRRRIAMEEGAGTALLIALFVAVPPVLAMGVYFNTWHSVRHVARLLPVAGPTREAARLGRLKEALWRFHLATLPTTLIALAMMAALWWIVRDRAGSSADFGLAALAIVSALTLPHVLVVLGMDRSQAVWTIRSRAGEVRP